MSKSAQQQKHPALRKHPIVRDCAPDGMGTGSRGGLKRIFTETHMSPGAQRGKNGLAADCAAKQKSESLARFRLIGAAVTGLPFVAAP